MNDTSPIAICKRTPLDTFSLVGCRTKNYNEIIV